MTLTIEEPSAVEPKRPTGVYLIIVFLVASTAYSVSLFIRQPNDYFHAVNVLIDIITIISIVGLWVMEKWGMVLTMVLSGIGIGMSLYNLNLAFLYPSSYYLSELLEVSMMSTALLVLDIAAAVYLATLIRLR